MDVKARPLKVPVARPFVGPEEEAAVAEVLRSGWLAQGPKVAEFESAVAAYVGARHAVAVSSCTTALHLGLVALGIGPGDEVICPSYSFIATANSVRHCGATPVLADIELATYNIDPRAVEAAVTPRTRAIMPVHQVGLPADIDRLLRVAERHGLAVVEDAACAIGAEYRGFRIGRPHGLMACFSFHARKVITTGEGGMVTTNDAALAERLRRLRHHGMSVSDLERHVATQVTIEKYGELGYNYRMTDLQAAVGLVQMTRLDFMLERRRELAAAYTGAFEKNDALIPPFCPEGMVHSWQSYLLRLKDTGAVRRDELMQRLLERGIATRRGIMAIHREPAYRAALREGSLPNTERAAATSLILPLYAQMAGEEQEFVVETLMDCLRR